MVGTPGRRRPPLPLPAALVAAVAGGLLLDLSFPSPGWWALAPLAVAALVVAVAGRRTLAAAGLGLVFGLAFFGPLLAWAGVYVGAIAWVPLALLQAGYLALFAAAAPWALRAPGGAPVQALALAGAWVAVEAARARTPFGGFGWGRLAFSQAEAPTLGLAAVGGPPLVSFAVALAGSLLAVAVLALAAPPRPPVAAAALAVAAVPALLAGLAVPLPTAPQAGSLTVAAVQGDVPRPGLDFNAERRAVLDNHARGTHELAEQVAAGQRSAPDVVLWPENASDIDPLRNADAYAVIDAAADAVSAPVVLGTVLLREDGRLSNASLVWRGGQGPVDRYDKQRPVPFAEYIPYRGFFRAITPAVDLVPRDFAPGDEAGVLDVSDARLGVLICFEVVPDDLVRDTVRGGAELLAVQTNNATFGFTDESVQQLAMSRLRAVEHGRAVAHVSTVGVSALIAPDGSVLQDTELFTPALLQAALPLRTDLTLATGWGGVIEALLCALGLLGVAAGIAVDRSRRSSRAAAGTPPAPVPQAVAR